ncbi:MAG: hypothetical protein WBA44_09575 [Mesorhizobium sp.]
MTKRKSDVVVLTHMQARLGEEITAVVAKIADECVVLDPKLKSTDAIRTLVAALRREVDYTALESEARRKSAMASLTTPRRA